MATERAFVDTNLFLRFLTNDVPAQADAVELLLKRAAAGEVELVTTALTVAEIVWTLESFYKLGRESIRDQVLAILNTPGLQIPEVGLVLQAITWYEDKNIDFIDAYHAAWLTAERLSIVYTFDERHFARIGGLEVRVPGARSPNIQ